MRSVSTEYRYPLFSQLPPSLKTLYSMVLVVMGIGYVFAMIQIYEVHSERDGLPGLSIEDIRIAYRGNPGNSKLEAALNGPMRNIVTPDNREIIITWVRNGSPKPEYDTAIQNIFSTQCIGCHDGKNPHIPVLTTYDDVKRLSAIDTGVSIGTLVRVSHIHLFGLTFIFFIMGIIFSHSYVKRWELKCAVIAIPFIAIIVDIASWWLTKVSTEFAYVVFIGGGLMGASFAYQWIVSMYQIWFFKCANGETCR